MVSNYQFDQTIDCINMCLANMQSQIDALGGGGSPVTADSPTNFTNKTGNISQWTNDANYLVAAALTPYQLVSNLQADLTASTSKYPSINAVNTGLGTKQATLISGTNIKTVGGTTLLGSGDVPFPTIPTNNNQLTNGSGFITASSVDTLTNKTLGGLLALDTTATRSIGTSTVKLLTLFTANINSNGTLRLLASASAAMYFQQAADATTVGGFFPTSGRWFFQAPGAINANTDTGEVVQIYGNGKVSANWTVGGNLNAAATILTNMTTTANAVIGTTLGVGGEATFTLDATFAANKGPVIRSPDNTKYRLVVANGGALSTTVVP